MSPTTLRPRHLLRTACLLVAAALAAVLVSWEPAAAHATEIAAAQTATEQSVPQAAIVTISVLSALIVVLLITFVVWMRRRGHAEDEDSEDASGSDGGVDSN
ncbi:hypothetical protein [Pseudoclavibacter sp. VKM Ac-2867]|uniref:hypothetical protein n=1 Tax=Pseudoclavibacter sp. VKM Ac-2867 TaxID=2783829 RepID=UPI00188BD613|nr:hypothetical protein [Pseudoclavibacter sp. VKM Ac-2867]MBF4457741.1 hypothetical protein [Pseudoclavibacter sp. VKM Ac-2867]